VCVMQAARLFYVPIKGAAVAEKDERTYPRTETRNRKSPARQRVQTAAGIRKLNTAPLRQLAYCAVDEKCTGAMILIQNLCST
jgi:hypothetical protein